MSRKQNKVCNPFIHAITWFRVLFVEISTSKFFKDQKKLQEPVGHVTSGICGLWKKLWKDISSKLQQTFLHCDWPQGIPYFETIGVKGTIFLTPSSDFFQKPGFSTSCFLSRVSATSLYRSSASLVCLISQSTVSPLLISSRETCSAISFDFAFNSSHRAFISSPCF